MNSAVTIVIKIIIGLLVLIGLYLMVQYLFKDFPFPVPAVFDKSGRMDACSNETKMCPDGTVVGRTGPDCSYGLCPSEIKEVSISGMMICLPHKNAKGPQTLECAFGLKGDDGKNYGLNDPEMKFLIGTPMNVNVTITGKLTEKEDSKYDSVGTIEIINLTRESN